MFFTHNIRKTIFSAVKNETDAAALGRYFSPKVRSEIMSEEKGVSLNEGRHQDVVVLFSDIRNFTAFCEGKSPKEVLDFLKKYHAKMVNAIFSCSGTLDKFIGDGILATFGTPQPSESDAANAVHAALAMRQGLEEINAERRSSGLPEFAQGIGIHFGPAIVGNIGSEERLEYTVIGDTVNIASRLESATKELQADILISKAVRERCRGMVKTEPEGTVSLKGRVEPVEVYSIRSERALNA